MTTGQIIAVIICVAAIALLSYIEGYNKGMAATMKIVEETMDEIKKEYEQRNSDKD